MRLYIVECYNQHTSHICDKYVFAKTRAHAKYIVKKQNKWVKYFKCRELEYLTVEY